MLGGAHDQGATAAPRHRQLTEVGCVLDKLPAALQAAPMHVPGVCPLVIIAFGALPGFDTDVVCDDALDPYVLLFLDFDQFVECSLAQARMIPTIDIRVFREIGALKIKV